MQSFPANLIIVNYHRLVPFISRPDYCNLSLAAFISYYIHTNYGVDVAGKYLKYGNKIVLSAGFPSCFELESPEMESEEICDFLLK